MVALKRGARDRFDDTIKGNDHIFERSTLFARVEKFDTHAPGYVNHMECMTAPYGDKLLPKEPSLNGWTVLQYPSHVNLGGCTVFKSHDYQTVKDLYLLKPPVLTLGDIQRLYFMPLVHAAKLLNMSPTMLKRACRKLGVNYWPHRQLAPLQKRIERIWRKLQDPDIYGILAVDHCLMESELRQLVQKSNDIVWCTNQGLRSVLRKKRKK